MGGFGKGFTRQKSGKAIEPRTMNQLMGPLEGLVRARAGPGMSQTTAPGGVPVMSASVLVARPAHTTEGPIDAMVGTTPGSEVVTFYEWDGDAFDLGSETTTAYNTYNVAVPDDRLVWLIYWAGAWWVLTAACAPAP
jgi:hypothetical protein